MCVPASLPAGPIQYHKAATGCSSVSRCSLGQLAALVGDGMLDEEVGDKAGVGQGGLGDRGRCGAAAARLQWRPSRRCAHPRLSLAPPSHPVQASKLCCLQKLRRAA